MLIRIATKSVDELESEINSDFSELNATELLWIFDELRQFVNHLKALLLFLHS